MQTIKIFTDGACLGNQYDNAKGGIGVVFLYQNGKLERFARGYKDTTNNRMELKAAIAGLHLAYSKMKKCEEKERRVELHTDSAYLANCFKDGWLDNWKTNGWKNSKRKPVANKDLWLKLDKLCNHFAEVVFFKVKGHSGNKYNELVDTLAVEAAEGKHGDLWDDVKQEPVASEQ